MRFCNFFIKRAGVLAIVASACALAQTVVLTLTPPMSVLAKRGSTLSVKLPAHMRDGYHCNSNTPSDEYLIPLKLSWTGGGPLQFEAVKYPKPSVEKYPFSDKPLSVFSGTFEIVTDFKVAADAKPGQVTLSGKLKYQACNDSMCLPPKTLDVQVPVIIE
jgi:DsbC/DsbD-like thiol-disulfide interchange protein